MLKVGITGGIGSGKSTACDMFKELDIPVFSADNYAKYILANDKSVRDSIIETFGKSVYDNNQLQRSKLASIVFNNPEKLAQLNAIVHPAVAKGFEKWIAGQKDIPYIVKEAAIMFESGSYKALDKVVTISVPEETRIQRVMDRDNISREEVLQRMKNQWTDEQRNSMADYVIHNESPDAMRQEILELHRIFSA